MNSELKIAVGTDAFPPTTDGISNVAQNYASLINKEHGKAVIVTPKTQINKTQITIMKYSDTKAGGFLQKKATASAGRSAISSATKS